MLHKCVSLFLAKNYVSSYIFSNTDCCKPASLSFVWFAIVHRSSNGRNTRRGGVENDPPVGEMVGLFRLRPGDVLLSCLAVSMTRGLL